MYRLQMFILSASSRSDLYPVLLPPPVQPLRLHCCVCCFLGCDVPYSGHYARTSPGPGGDWSKPVLLEAEDGNKDQTYFLCGVPAEGLAKVFTAYNLWLFRW